MISALTPGVQHDFAGLYAKCNEVEQQTAMATMQPVEVKMYRVVIDQEAEQQAATANAGSEGPPPPPFGPVILPPGGSSPAPAPGGVAATDVEQYHARCTTANILTCVPVCNAAAHGYELLATIEGTDTKFSCNLAHGLYSWMGAASEGGYLGSDFASFFSAVVSGATGSYIVTLVEDAGIGTDLVIRPGQDVRISGDPAMQVGPSWGDGAFTVESRSVLQLTR